MLKEIFSIDAAIFWLLFVLILLFMLFTSYEQAHFIQSYWQYMIVPVALVGIPHGFLDPLIALDDKFPYKFGMASFLSVYLSVSVFCWIFWQLFPHLSLGLFLIISAYHFGGDFEEHKDLLRFKIGSALLLSPIVFHFNEVHDIFFQISTFKLQEYALIYFCYYFLIFFVLLDFGIKKNNKLEIIALTLLSFTLHPLLYFVIYFCFLHSIRHYYQHREYIKVDKNFIVLMIVLVLFTFILNQAQYQYFYVLGSSFFDASLKTVFIGLFSLTVPHMFIVESDRKSY